MIWFIEDYNEYQIFITDLWREYYIPKFRITMVVEEPYLYLYWNDREKGDGGDQRVLRIDYLDVVDGYGGYADNPGSAQSLKDIIDGYIVSGFAGGGDILTDKADLLSHDGVSDTILPGGTNEYVLRRNNSTQTGLEWASPASVVVDGGGVQSVTGLDTDNTDPQNPVVNIAVDGVTITGDGTVGDPLVASGSGIAADLLSPLLLMGG